MMDDAKAAIGDIIERLLEAGVRKTVIEIELTHFIKRELSKEDEY